MGVEPFLVSSSLVGVLDSGFSEWSAHIVLEPTTWTDEERSLFAQEGFLLLALERKRVFKL